MRIPWDQVVSDGRVFSILRRYVALRLCPGRVRLVLPEDALAGSPLRLE